METTAANKGQSLAEYVLYGGLMTLVAIGGLLALNSSVGDMFTVARGRLSMGGQQANAAQNQGVAAANGQAALPVANAVASPYPMTMAGYQQMLADMPMIIETTGSSGATKQLSSYMIAVVEKALVDAKISPEQASQLIELANMGHNLGEMQEVFIGAVEAAPPDALVETIGLQELTIGGVTETVNNMADHLQTLDWEISKKYNRDFFNELIKAPLEEQGAFMIQHKGSNNPSDFEQYGERFVVHYTNLKQSGALADNPELSAVVEQLAGGIRSLTQSSWSSSRDFGSWMDVNRGKTKAFTETDSRGWSSRKEMAKNAVTTDLNATGICTAGNGSDDGSFCSG